MSITAHLTEAATALAHGALCQGRPFAGNSRPLRYAFLERWGAGEEFRARRGLALPETPDRRQRIAFHQPEVLQRGAAPDALATKFRRVAFPEPRLRIGAPPIFLLRGILGVAVEACISPLPAEIRISLKADEVVPHFGSEHVARHAGHESAGEAHLVEFCSDGRIEARVRRQRIREARNPIALALVRVVDHRLRGALHGLNPLLLRTRSIVAAAQHELCVSPRSRLVNSRKRTHVERLKRKLHRSPIARGTESGVQSADIKNFLGPAFLLDIVEPVAHSHGVRVPPRSSRPRSNLFCTTRYQDHPDEAHLQSVSRWEPSCKGAA